MKLSNRIPLIYPTLKRHFGIQWDKGIIITYGDTVYCKYLISEDLKVHEATHVKQQTEYGVKEWWDRYLIDKQFRLSQELEAYKNQANWIRENKVKHGDQLIDKIHRDISSYIYGNIISYEEAKKLI